MSCVLSKIPLVIPFLVWGRRLGWTFFSRQPHAALRLLGWQNSPRSPIAFRGTLAVCSRLIARFVVLFRYSLWSDRGETRPRRRKKASVLAQPSPIATRYSRQQRPPRCRRWSGRPYSPIPMSPVPVCPPTIARISPDRFLRYFLVFIALNESGLSRTVCECALIVLSLISGVL